MYKINTLIKKGILRSILLKTGLDKLDIKCLYTVLLNNESVAKIKPFNMIRYTENITEKTGIFKVWLQVNSRMENEPDYYITGKRVARALLSACQDYLDMLPDGLSGSNSIMLMFRLFFMSDEDMQKLTEEEKEAANFVIKLLQTITLLDIIFSNEQEINGFKPEELLAKLITTAQYNIDELAVEIGSNVEQINMGA